MLRLITKLLPRRKTLLILLILLTVSLLQHTFTPAPLLQTGKATQQKNLLLAQLPLQASHTFYKHTDKVPTDKTSSSHSEMLTYGAVEHFANPVEYKLFNWYMLLYQGTLHKRDYA